MSLRLSLSSLLEFPVGFLRAERHAGGRAAGYHLAQLGKHQFSPMGRSPMGGFPKHHPKSGFGSLTFGQLDMKEMTFEHHMFCFLLFLLGVGWGGGRTWGEATRFKNTKAGGTKTHMSMRLKMRPPHRDRAGGATEISAAIGSFRLDRGAFWGTPITPTVAFSAKKKPLKQSSFLKIQFFPFETWRYRETNIYQAMFR